MPIITKIDQQKRRENRRNVHLDGRFAFACNANVVKKFDLKVGMELTAEKVTQVLQGEVLQECFDRAMGFLERRMHSSVELRRKLMRHEYGEQVLDATFEKLKRLGYVNDEAFAKQKAEQMQRRMHGRRSAMAQLLKAGVKPQMADQTLAQTYSPAETQESARTFIQKQVKRLGRLEPVVAKRRLIGQLQRRGFDYQMIKPLVDEYLTGKGREDEESENIW